MARRSQSDDLGIPPGLQIYSSFPFAGLNLSSARPAMRDQEFYNIENFVRIGDGFLRTLWDNGAALYTVSGSQTIVNAFFYNIASTQYVVVFLSDGTAYQVQVSNSVITTISSSVGTFYSGISLPGCIQWGSQYLIIGNNNTQNSYWVWDGSVLYGSGTLSPIITITDGGSGYTSVPSVVAYGGVGTGATFLATIQNGSVVSIYVTNPGSGYGINDQVQLLITGGGSDNPAQLEAVLSNTTLSSIVVTAGGSGYTSAPTVTIGPPNIAGVQATATATVTSNAVTNVTITNPGSGYTSVPTVSFGGPGTGALATAFITPGYISAINVISGGSGYTSPPTLTIVGGGGTGATATAILSPSSVSSIVVTNGGSGYTFVTVATISAPNMSGGVQAEASALVVNGQVTSIAITNAGSGYTLAPTVTISGSGTGATASATITISSIASVTVNNAGSGYTSIPAVEVESGVNRSATAIVELMPYGISGTTLESFQGRVFIANAFTPLSNPPSKNNGNRMFISAPGSISDFSTGDGGVIYTATDRFLRQRFVALQQSNGYLYPIGDSSVSIISGVTTSGSPTTTTFNYQNTDPQVGTSFRDSCQDFGRTILFANPLGVYGLYGGSVTKVSQPLDPLFSFASFPPSSGALTPTSAVANIYGGKYYLLLMTLLDPFTFTYQNKMIVWDEESWFIASQTANLTFILTQEVNSDLMAWGSDGKSIYPLFETPNTALTKSISTKLFGGNNPLVAKEAYTVMVQSVNTGSFGQPVTFTLSLDTDGGTFPIGTYTFSLSSNYEFGYPFFVTGQTNAVGIYLGISLSTNDADITLNYLGLTYIPSTFQIGSIGLTVPGQS